MQSVLRVALVLRRRALALLTLERHPDLVFEFTTSSTTEPSRSNSASWSKVDTNDTATSSTIPKEKYFDTRSVQYTAMLPSHADESFPRSRNWRRG